MVFYYDPGSGKKWNKKFNPGPNGKDLDLKSISSNGDVLLSADRIYLLNSDGDIIWSRDRSTFAGFMRLSWDGSYSLQVLRGKLTVFENSKGNHVLSMNSISFNNGTYSIYRAFFIEGDKENVAILSVDKNQGINLFISDLKGRIINRYELNELYKRNLEIYKLTDNTYSVYLDGIKRL